MKRLKKVLETGKQDANKPWSAGRLLGGRSPLGPLPCRQGTAAGMPLGGPCPSSQPARIQFIRAHKAAARMKFYRRLMGSAGQRACLEAPQDTTEKDRLVLTRTAGSPRPGALRRCLHRSWAGHPWTGGWDPLQCPDLPQASQHQTPAASPACTGHACTASQHLLIPPFGRIPS